jgi:hypothetical protein
MPSLLSTDRFLVWDPIIAGGWANDGKVITYSPGAWRPTQNPPLPLAIVPSALIEPHKIVFVSWGLAGPRSPIAIKLKLRFSGVLLLFPVIRVAESILKSGTTMPSVLLSVRFPEFVCVATMAGKDLN